MESIFAYLSDLSQNNDREWYRLNKSRYQEANADFENFIGQLIAHISEFDESIAHNNPKDLTFKLARDTRFAHDKSPYNPKFRAHISSKGKAPIPVGYYVVIAPGGNSFLGGGLFASMFKEATSMVRNYIVGNGDELSRIISGGQFEIKGDALKKLPKGYDGAHPLSELLKNKSWYLEKLVADEQAQASGFAASAAQVFRTMKPFNDFLNKALIDFEMPKR
ncbi:MAG: DUF2461 domain-containing protein [Eubacteriaceae bacterium]|nr:DUF2461 domain-containing protein [Eubacteriaceae bacterium]